MSLVWFTDSTSKQKVAINPKYVVAVFVASEGPAQGTTIIGLVNGNISVSESDIDVVSQLSA